MGKWKVIPGCPCGLKSTCPYGSTTLNCPEWQNHIKPKWYERIIGFFGALFMGSR